MQLNEYQKLAAEFRRYNSPEYLVWAIKAEAGELNGVFARIYRGDDGNHEEDLIKEAGDVLWVMSMMYEEIGKPIHEQYGKRTTNANQEKAADWLFRLSPFISEQFSRNNVDEITTQVALRYLEIASNSDISVIAEKNIEKLASRRDRNLIKGKGDNR